MIENITLPQRLKDIIGSERVDFAVKSGRAEPWKTSISLIIFGLFWLGFTSIFILAFIGPLFSGGEVRFTSNGVPVVATPENIGPIIFPAIFLGFFLLIGAAILSFGIFTLFKPGGYFVGTPTRIINFKKGKYRSADWEQLTGIIEVEGDDKKGNISLQMRTGKYVSGNNDTSRYVPDTIYISGISNVFEIEKICRQRIKENDPTPAVQT